MLVEGDNVISVTRKHPDPAGNDGTRNTITIQMGSGTGDKLSYIDGEVVISEIKIEKEEVTPLAAPEFAYDAETKKITVTDTANAAEDVKEYQVGLFNEAGELVKSFKQNNNAIDLSGLTDGTYTFKVKAVSKNLVKSDLAWGEGETPVTVTVVTEAPELPEAEA